MLERFFVVLGQVSTLFLLMGVGFFMARGKKLSPASVSELSTLLLYVVSPAIIIDCLQTDCDPALLRVLGIGAVATLLLYVLYALLMKAFFRGEKEDMRAVLRFGSMYGNTGFMGLPLIQAVLGDEARLFAVVGLVVFNLATWTHGLMLMSGERKISLKKVILSPGCLGVLVGLPLFLTHSVLPGPLYSTVHFLGALNTPLAMVVIGAQMARADLPSTFRQRKLYGAAAVKLILIPLVTAAVMFPLRRDLLLYTATVILAATPTAGITSMFGERFQRAPERAAQLVTLSTLLSIVTLPVLAVLAERLAAL